MRSYRPADIDAKAVLPAYVFFHGGGMLLGSIGTEDYTCALVSSRAKYEVLSVCYRHTPEFTFPTAIDDAWDAFEWIVANAEALAIDPAQLVVGGVSAGGCLGQRCSTRR